VQLKTSAQEKGWRQEEEEDGQEKEVQETGGNMDIPTLAGGRLSGLWL